MADDDTTRLIRTMIELRHSRPKRFPREMFQGELAWDIVLTLFIADAEGEKLTAGEAIKRAGGNIGPGERWMSYLSRENMVAGDGTGRTDDVVSLTPDAVQQVEEWAGEMIEPLRAFSIAELTR